MGVERASAESAVRRLHDTAREHLDIWTFFWLPLPEPPLQQMADNLKGPGGRNVIECVQLLSSTCAASAGDDCQQALEHYAIVSRQPHWMGCVNGRSAVELILNCGSNFFQGISRVTVSQPGTPTISAPNYVGRGPFTEQDRQALRAILPVIDRGFRNAGLLPDPTRCDQLRAEINWELGRALDRVQLPEGNRPPTKTDTVLDRPKKRRHEKPKNLKALKAVKGKVDRDRKKGVLQEESVREFVEEHFPELVNEAEIKRKVSNLTRYLSRYKHLLG
jgi:hypothetical protein